MAKFLVGSALSAALLSVAKPAFSQSAAGSEYPPPAPAAGNYPTAPAPGGPQPGAYPAAPAPQQGTATAYPAAPAPVPGPPTAYAGPAPQNQPAAYQPPPPSATYPSASQSSGYGYPPPNQGGTTSGDASQRPVGEPSEPPQETPFKLPDMSVRVDPLNWLIYGRLGLELEAAVWKFISVELVPVFVTDEQPPFMNLGSFPANVYQKSNGVGAMSGASIGAGFWLNQTPFRGTVFRVLFTNYGYTYETTDDAGRIDIASHTDRRIYGFLGSHSKWGPFTIASGIGLGAELNRQRRCMDTSTLPVVPTTVDCKKDVFDLQLERGRASTYGVYGWLHPAYLDFRLSLGLVF